MLTTRESHNCNCTAVLQRGAFDLLLINETGFPLSQDVSLPTGFVPPLLKRNNSTEEEPERGNRSCSRDGCGSRWWSPRCLQHQCRERCAPRDHAHPAASLSSDRYPGKRGTGTCSLHAFWLQSPEEAPLRHPGPPAAVEEGGVKPPPSTEGCSSPHQFMGMGRD